MYIWQVSLQQSCDDTFQMWTYVIAQVYCDNFEVSEMTEQRKLA